MKKKIALLVVSALFSLLSYTIFYSQSFDICDLYCGPALGQYYNLFLFFPFILFFSLITLKLPEPVFASWYRFTLYTAPVILVLSFVINLGWHHTIGGFFNTSGMFDIPAQLFLYTLYTLGSTFTIWRAYVAHR